MEKEIWKPVRGKEDWAEISNYGQIHYYAGKSRRFPDEHWTYGSEDKVTGYLQATIGGVTKGVHIFVYETFNECDIPKGYEVNHIDEDKHLNCVWNLNLMTKKENIRWGTGIERSAASRRGRKLSEEHKAKLSVAHRGRKQSPEHIAKKAAANSKPIQGLDKITGEVVFTFPSAAEAQRQGFGDHRHISECCNGKRKSYKGYIWRYAVQ